MIRDLRRSDGPRLFELTKLGFPEEEAVLGTTPEGFARVVRRAFRWDTRFLIGLARVLGRPLFRYLVVEENGEVVATTLVSFAERTGHVNSVMVDPAYRRRGLARALLERARELTRAAGRKYITLDVLSENVPARTLYDRIGYRPIWQSGLWVHAAGAPPTAPSSSAVRPFRASDAAALARIAEATRPPEVLEVLPIRAGAIRGSRFVDRMLASTTAAWVVDPGSGPEAHVAATVGAATTAAHFSDPIVGPSAAEPDVAALLATAVGWTAARGAPRIACRVPVTNVRGRAALLGGGFREALTDWTLSRTVD